MESKGMLETLRKYRRDLHRTPELGFKEFKTKDYLLKVLRKYNCRLRKLNGYTSFL